MKVYIEKFQSEANLKHFHNSEKIQKSVTVFKNYMSKTLLEL